MSQNLIFLVVIFSNLYVEDQTMNFRYEILFPLLSGGNIMVWDSMTANWLRILCFIERTMTSNSYIDILHSNLKDSLKN